MVLAQPLCANCDQPIERDDTTLDWFHLYRSSSDTDMLCYPSREGIILWAEPRPLTQL